MQDFDRIFTNETSSIGCIFGSSRVLFIKTGQGGSIYGYENKYLKLATYANEKYGCSVFVSSTLGDGKDAYDYEMSLVKEFVGSEDVEIYYLGVSKGGLIGCWYGADNQCIRKLISVNAPLMLNFHNRTLPALKKLEKERVTMVYGTLDPSYRYVEFLKSYATIKIIEGENHHLSNVNFEFEQLADELLSEL